jgi:ElaA protein
MNWTLKSFADLTTTELYQILRLRSEVFVVEQNCIFQDIDNNDQSAYHLFTQQKDDTVLAYTRLFKPGDYYDEASIGRVLVKESERSSGLGYKLMEESIKQVYKLYNRTPIKIGAQLYLKNFYQNLGFEQISEPYIEDGIPHIYMLKP